MTTEFVWLTEERCYGILVNHGAYVSTVRIERNGQEQIIQVENDEVVLLWEEEYDEEDEQ